MYIFVTHNVVEKKGLVKGIINYLDIFFLRERLLINMTKYNINRITSHVNSLKRKSTEFSTPIELFYAHYGHEILNKLGISLIEPNSVMLSNELVK